MNTKHIRANLYIRWLDAIRHTQYTNWESIKFEMARSGDAACEPIWFHAGKHMETYIKGAYTPNAKYHLGNAQIGLLINPTNVFKVFPFDCWSYYGDPKKGQNPNKLYYGHESHTNDHAEAWYRTSLNKCAICGIVCYEFYKQHPATQKELRAMAQHFKLKLYTQNEDGYIKEVKNM